MDIPQNETPIVPAEGGLNVRNWGGRSLLSFLLALAILAFFAARLEINYGQIWETIKGADPALAVAALVTYYLVFPIRALRWRILLKNVEPSAQIRYTVPSLPALTQMLFLSWFVNCIMPAKLGDGYRAYQFKRATQGSLSSALGTIFAERFIDVAVLMVLLISALLTLGKISTDAQGAPTNVLGAGVLLLVVGTVGLGGMWVMREHLPRLMPQRVQAVYARFQHGILGSFQKLFLVVPLSFVVWFTEVGRVFFVAQAMSLDLSPPYIVLLALTQALLSVVPFTPGGLGLVETGLVGLLLFAGIPKELAVASALLDRTISYWSILLFGFIIFVARRKV